MRLSRCGASLVWLCGLAAPLAAMADPQLKVVVQPRIGVFDRFLYARENVFDRRPALTRLADDRVRLHVTERWNPLTVDDYWAGVDPRLRAALPTGARFEMLVGEAPHIGYARRTATVGLAGVTKGSATSCELFVDGNAAAAPWATDPCHWTLSLGNAAAMLRLRAQVDGRPIELTGTVPEDFLIVVLGDSFASGEGNPDGRAGNRDGSDACDARVGSGLSDVVKDQQRDSRCAPLWMDALCHRSLWSGPMQAALRLMRGPQNDGLERSGAWTVLSLACSGATIKDGLMEEYELTPRTLWDLRREFAPLGLKPVDAALEKSLRKAYPMPAQLRMLETTLASDHGGKRSVDVLTLSIGGNDIAFSSIVEDLFRNDLAGGQFEQLRAIKADRLRELQAQQFVALARRLHALDVRHLLVTEYPDPTRTSAAGVADTCDDMGDAPGRYCDGAVAAGYLARPLADLLDKRLSRRESRFVHCHIVRPLGSTLAGVSQGARWRFVDGIAASFHGHGWCGDAVAEPYAEQARWFRRLDESWAFQGNPYGAVHPTWQGHLQGIAPRLEQAIGDGLRRPLGVALKSRVVARDETSYLALPLEVSVSEAGTDATGAHPTCLTDGTGPAACEGCFGGAGASERCARDGLIQAVALQPGAALRVQHVQTRRVFEQPLLAALQPGTRRLALDQSPPTVTGLDRLPGLDAAGCVPRWLAGGCDFELRVADLGAGVAALDAELRTCATPDTPWPECSGPALRWRDVPPSAQPDLRVALGTRIGIDTAAARLSVSAVDALGNTTLAREYALGIDRAPPRLEAITMLGAGAADLARPRALPVTVGEQTPIVLSLHDATSFLAGVEFRRQAGNLPSTLQTSTGAWRQAAVDVQYDASAFAAERGSVQLEVRARDQAGNATVVANLMLLPVLPKAGRQALLAADWLTAARAAERARCHERAMLLSPAVPAALPAAEDEGWFAWAAWLDVACGYALPAQPVSHRLGEACDLGSTDQPGTLWALLVRAERCTAAAPTAAVAVAAANELRRALAGMAQWRVPEPGSE